MPDVKALGSTMHYQESGSGTRFVFLHGNSAGSGSCPTPRHRLCCSTPR